MLNTWWLGCSYLDLRQSCCHVCETDIVVVLFFGGSGSAVHISYLSLLLDALEQTHALRRVLHFIHAARTGRLCLLAISVSVKDTLPSGFSILGYFNLVSFVESQWAPLYHLCTRTLLKFNRLVIATLLW